VVAIEIGDPLPDAVDDSLTIQVRTIPESLDAVKPIPSVSAVAPGPETGLVILRPDVAENVSAVVSVSWEDNTARVFSRQLHLAALGRRFACLVECPVRRIGWGDLTDPDAPGALIGDGKVPIAACTPLAEGDFSCGDVVTLRGIDQETDIASIKLSITATSEGADVPDGAFDLFGNIRQLLDDEGIAGRQNSSLGLLPKPLKPSDS